MHDFNKVSEGIVIIRKAMGVKSERPYYFIYISAPHLPDSLDQRA